VILAPNRRPAWVCVLARVSNRGPSQRSSFGTHTGSVSGWWQEAGLHSRNMSCTFPVRLPDIELKAKEVVA